MSFPKVKKYVQKALGQFGVYERAKASLVYDFYWRLADRRVIDQRQEELDFYRGVLDGFREGDLIFDIGANQGYKTDIFFRLCARVVAVEPDETCQEILKQKFLKHRFKKKALTVVERAVSDRSSVTTMWIDEPASAKNTLSRKWAEALRTDDSRFGHRLGFTHRASIETVTIEQLIALHGLPFFVKIDVEGHELSVLRGMQQPVPYLSFEVNLPDFKAEGLECVRVLEGLAPGGDFNYTPDCRKGLVLNQWHRVERFSAIVDSCTEPCIEVFWRTWLRNRN